MEDFSNRFLANRATETTLTKKNNTPNSTTLKPLEPAKETNSENINTNQPSQEAVIDISKGKVAGTNNKINPVEVAFGSPIRNNNFRIPLPKTDNKTTQPPTIVGNGNNSTSSAPTSSNSNRPNSKKKDPLIHISLGGLQGAPKSDSSPTMTRLDRHPTTVINPNNSYNPHTSLLPPAYTDGVAFGVSPRFNPNNNVLSVGYNVSAGVRIDRNFRFGIQSTVEQSLTTFSSNNSILFSSYQRPGHRGSQHNANPVNTTGTIYSNNTSASYNPGTGQISATQGFQIDRNNIVRIGATHNQTTNTNSSVITFTSRATTLGIDSTPNGSTAFVGYNLDRYGSSLNLSVSENERSHETRANFSFGIRY